MDNVLIVVSVLTLMALIISVISLVKVEKYQKPNEDETPAELEAEFAPEITSGPVDANFNP